jgi:integrase/recombinase XerD
MAHPSSIIVTNEEYYKQAAAYKDYLLKLGHSKHGSQVKYYWLMEFFSFLEKKGINKITQIRSEHINEYHNYVKNRPNKDNPAVLLSERSIYENMRTIQKYFSMQQEIGKLKKNPSACFKYNSPRGNHTPRNILTQKEIKQLFQTCQNLKEKAILSLAYGCGLRVSEIVQCNIENIRLKEKILIIPQGKGNKKRIIPLSNTIAETLREYFFNHRIQQDTIRQKAFILNQKERRMQYYTYNAILKLIINRTGNPEIQEKNITIHNLRHSIATHLLEKGMELEKVKLFLGHSHLKSTEIYTRVTIEQLKKL